MALSTVQNAIAKAQGQATIVVLNAEADRCGADLSEPLIGLERVGRDSEGSWYVNGLRV